MGGVGEEPDEDAVTTSQRDVEETIRHRKIGHEAALELADKVGRPDLLAPQIQETEHRLAEDEDILEEIAQRKSDED